MIALPFVFFIAFLFFYWKANQRSLGVVGYLVSIYVLSFFSAVILDVFFDYKGTRDIKLGSLFYLTGCLLVLFTAFSSFKDYRFKCIVIYNRGLVRLLDLSILPLGLAALVFFGYYAKGALGEDVAAARHMMAAGEVAAVASAGIFNSILSLVANLFVLNLLFAFFNFTRSYPRASIKRGYLHLLASVSYVFYVFAYSGRDGVVYWLITFVFFYFFFKDFLDALLKVRILKVSSIMMVFFLAGFIYITVSRFGEDGAGGIYLSLFEYAGQQIYIFNDHFYSDFPLAMGMKSFEPLAIFLAGLFGVVPDGFDRVDWFEYFLRDDVTPWAFGTFINSFVHDFGRIGTLFFVSIFAVFIRINLRKVSLGGVMSFEALLLFILFFQIVSWGVFYFRQYSAFFYMLVMILFAVAFRMQRLKTRFLLIKIA